MKNVTKCLAEGKLCCPVALSTKKEKEEQSPCLLEGCTCGNTKWKPFIISLTLPLLCFLFPTPCPLFQSVEFPFVVSLK